MVTSTEEATKAAQTMAPVRVLALSAEAVTVAAQAHVAMGGMAEEGADERGAPRVGCVQGRADETNLRPDYLPRPPRSPPTKGAGSATKAAAPCSTPRRCRRWRSALTPARTLAQARPRRCHRR